MDSGSEPRRCERDPRCVRGLCYNQTCKPTSYQLCPICKGDGCLTCEGQIITGLLRIDDDWESVKITVTVHSDSGDPILDALIDGTTDSLIESLKTAKTNMIVDQMERELNDEDFV